MQNRFGLKDFFVIVLLLAVTTLLLVNMAQSDRLFLRVQDAESAAKANQDALAQLRDGIENVQATVRGLERRLDAGAFAAPATTDAPPNTRRAPLYVDDRSWAIEGVEVVELPPLDFVHDPRDEPDFQYGGELTILMGNRATKVMPYFTQEAIGADVLSFMVETLAGLHPETFERVASLANAYQMSPDGRRVRVHIDPRARWSDGAPVTAHDVKFTWDDIISNPQLNLVRWRTIYANLDRVEVITDQVAEFHFKEVLFNNLDLALGFGPMPMHFYSTFSPRQLEDFTSMPLQSGPYMVASLDPEDQWTQSTGDYVMVRNPNYWGERPTFDRVRFKFFTNPLAVLQEYENQDGDVMDANAKQYVTKRVDEKFREFTQILNWIPVQSGYRFIGWNCGERKGKLTPFHDTRVRRAMTHLLDRERIITDFYDGVGEVATGPFPRGPAESPNVEPIPFDLQAARRLLAQAGWIDRDNDGVLENADGDDFAFEVTYPAGNQPIAEIARYLKDQCFRVGIRCSTRQQEWTVYGETLDQRDFDAIMLGWRLGSNPEADPKQVWHTDGIAGGDNFIQWDGGQDKYIDAGRAELDREQRMQIWHRFHELVHEEQPYTFLARSPKILFVNKRLGNVRPVKMVEIKTDWYVREQ